MKKRIIFFVFLINCGVSFANNQIDSLLQVLDIRIQDKEIYFKIKETNLDILKSRKNEINNLLEDTYILNNRIYEEYRSYNSDSAIHYLNQNINLALSFQDETKAGEASIILANMFAELGRYKETTDLLESVNKNHYNSDYQIKYYQAYYKVYRSIAETVQNRRDSLIYRNKSNLYGDSICIVAESNSEAYLRVQEVKKRESGQLKQALEFNDQRLKQAASGTPIYALVTYDRALIYDNMQNTDLEKKYLILSTITDIELAIRDNGSIPLLIDMLTDTKDIDRAYNYIHFTVDNMTSFNTNVRGTEVLNIQRKIDKAYQLKNDKYKRVLTIGLLLISLLSVLLIISIFYVYKQMKKGIVTSKHLREVNQELYHLNKKLHHLNDELKAINLEVVEANHIKEEYIAYFLHECLSYIDKLDLYRKMVNKKIADREFENLYKITKDHTLKEQALKSLFINFDSMFIHLFPNFVEEFNSLLVDDKQIILKKGELNTELRIYALMRLGINDNNQIAEFLGYSVKTIYNYRAKMKSMAKIAREDFEWTVKKIGSF